MTRLGVRSLEQKNQRTLEITWTDGITSLYDVVRLRDLCPCAWCEKRRQREAQGQHPATSFDHVRPKLIQSCGRYALRITFDDGHHQGIYTFAYLRSLSEETSAHA